jgi:hypothetical protein
MEQNVESKVESIVEKVLDMNPEDKEFSAEAFAVRVQQAKIGMTYNRDKNQNERIKQGQMIRVIGMIASSPEAREKYIEATQPGLLPALQTRPKLNE